MRFYTNSPCIKMNPAGQKKKHFNHLLTVSTILVFILSTLNGYSQRVTLNERNKPITAVFREIRKQTGLDFIYNVKDLKKTGNVTVVVNNEDLSVALKQLFAGSDLIFEIKDKSITIREVEKRQTEHVQPPMQITIRGKVTDNKDIPLIGATVKAKNANRSVVTNDEGEFVLANIESKEVIVISYTGYTTRELPLNYNFAAPIVLTERMQNMNEVVVVGYGTQKKVNLTGAVSQISGDDLKQRSSPNIIASLQGMMPGLNIQSNNGNFNEAPEINVRGFNSINGGSPLILIDGFQGSLNRINPADVESVTVLKDAASSAIYGARGAFGVILITTKKGKSGKIEINYSNNFGFTRPATRTDYITDPYTYGKTADAALYGYNGTNYTGYTDADYERIKQVMDGTLAPFKEQQPNGSYKFFYNTNWYDFLFRKTQFTYNHNVSVSGGSEKLQGYLSGRVYKTQSIQNIEDANLKLINVKASVRAKPTNWLELSYNTLINNTNNREYGGGKNGYGGLWSNTTWYYLFPFHPTEIDGIPFDFTGSGAQGPLSERSNYIREQSEQYVNTLGTKVIVNKDLQFNMDYSSTITHSSSSTRLNQYKYLTGDKIIPTVGGVNRLTEKRNRAALNAMNIYGTYNASLARKHNFKLMLGFNHEEFESDYVTAAQNGLLANNLANLNLGTEMYLADGEAETWAIQGYFGRLNYDFKNKYLLEVNARYDGSSRFPRDSRWGFFPSVSTGWYVSKEKFYAPLKEVMSSLKLRVSYGKLGNQNIDNNTFSQLLEPKQTTWLINNGKANFVEAPLPLPKVVSWENSRTIDFGADLGFFNDQFTVSFDWYEKNIEGMYLPGQRLPAVFGAAEPKENIASLRNRGFELSFTYNNTFNVAGSDLRLRATASVYNFKGVITKYPNPNGLMSTFWEGQKLGTIYGYRIGGQFQSDKEAKDYQNSFTNPATSLGQVYNYELNIVQNTEWKGLRAGDIKYLDLNGDGAINKGKNTLADHGDLDAIGNAMPQFPFGFSISAEWKDFDLSIAGTGITRQDWYATGDIYWGTYERPYLSFIRKDLITNAWTAENPGNTYPQINRGYASLGNQRSLGEVNDYYLINVGYMRIKNLTIGYTLPERLTKKAQIQRMRVYFSGENIFTWRFGNLTKYIDPEMAGAGINYSSPGSAVNRARAEDYPIGRILSAGVNITL